jgi:multiple sugar transport system substrate-binding protein
MKKSILTILMITMAFVLLTACGGGSKTDTSTEAKAGEADSKAGEAANSTETSQSKGGKRVVTIWYDGTEEESVKRLEPEFEALNPDIDLQFEIVPYSDLSTKEMVACQSEVGPDVMWQSYAWTNSFAKMGLLMSYSDYLDKSDAIHLEDDFDPVALELGTVDGQIYGLPWSMEAMCLVYNKDMFREAGLDPEKPPANWEELIDYAQKLTIDSNGDGVTDQYGYGLVGNLTGNTWFRFIPELWSAGGEVANDDMTQGTLDSPEAVEAMTYYTELLTKYKAAPEGSVNNGAAEVRTLFNNKNVAMYVDGQPAVKNIQKDAADIDVGVALWPGKNGPLDAGLGGYYIATPKNAANPDDAWTFIEYFLSKEVQEYFPISFPANLKARDTDRFSDEISQTFAKQLKNTKNFQPLPDTPGAQQIVLDAVQSILAGMNTPEEALKQANESLNETLK